MSDESQPYGPGSDPSLFEDVRTYRLPSVVDATFIPLEEQDIPVEFDLRFYEVSDHVFGQVLCNRKFRSYDDEYPHLGPESPPVNHSLEYESAGSLDPLDALWMTVSGLESCVDDIVVGDVVLDAVSVNSSDYKEVGIELVKEYGTAVADVDSCLRMGEVYLPPQRAVDD